MAESRIDQSSTRLLPGARPNAKRLDVLFYFIGDWKDHTPLELIKIKREADRCFFVALPIFTDDCEKAYVAFMGECFEAFGGGWGRDAKLRTGYVRRQEAASTWQQEWNEMFTYTKDSPVPAAEIAKIRRTYGTLLAVLAKDIKLLEARERYATTSISSNAV